MKPIYSSARVIKLLAMAIWCRENKQVPLIWAIPAPVHIRISALYWETVGKNDKGSWGGRAECAATCGGVTGVRSGISPLTHWCRGRKNQNLPILTLSWALMVWFVKDMVYLKKFSMLAIGRFGDLWVNKVSVGFLQQLNLKTKNKT